MPKNKYIFGILFLVWVLSSCSNSSENPFPPSHATGAKPSEDFFLQRSYPQLNFPVRAYMAAMQASEGQASFLRGNVPAGFDGKWENIAPSNFSGRVNAVAIHPKNESILYAGLASGGLFKSVDAGKSWVSVFDDHAWLAIGAIAIDPGNPEVVYVGTGDPNVTGYPFLGNGIYRSADGGKTWQHLGLGETRIISAIVVHPENPDVVWVGAQGLPLERNSDRGVYKTEDRGKSWKKVLYVSNQAGVADLVLDPFDPNYIYAAFWDRIRNNRESITSGPDGSVYASWNGGNNWSRCTLPTGPNTGRIALAVSGITRGRVFARIVAADQELDNIYRSDDYGRTWSPVIDWSVSNLTRTGALGNNQFGWYFGSFAVHPDNDFELYLLGIDLWRSGNGGRNWELGAPSWRQYIVHADKHALVFAKSGKMILATDGGLYEKKPGEESWSALGALPGLQYYRIGYNPHEPEMYYAGAQDLGTLQGGATGPWKRLYDSDGFKTLFNADDPQVVYVQIQYGRKFVSLNKGATWRSASNGVSINERTHWDTPFETSVHGPHTMYTATYRVFKSKGTVTPQWSPISPDLTDGNIYGNAFHTVSALSDSPKDSNVVYAGTTDGNLWRYTGSASLWVPIQSGLPNRYVTSVHASPEWADHVFVTFSGYKDNENLPHVFWSSNKGANWTNISGDLPPLAVNDLLVLPGHKDSILFAATDGGVYASKNKGIQWFRLGASMPHIAVYDLVWNKAQNQLVAGSYGRAIFTYSIDYFLQKSPVAVRNREKSKLSMSVFPNPADEKARITWNGFPGNPGFLSLFSASGQLQWTREVDLSAPNLELDASKLPSGTYFLVLQDRSGSRSTVSFIRR